MKNLFVEKIIIKSVRHLKNKQIDLSNETKKHLIITGKNGTGKTSLLESIMDYITIFDDYSAEDLRRAEKNIETHLSAIYALKRNNNGLNSNEVVEKILEQEKYIYNNQTRIDRYNANVSLEFNNYDLIDKLYKSGDYIITYFNASRISQMSTPSGIEKINLDKKFRINDSAGEIFVKYLVDLKAKEMFADHGGNYEVAKNIKRWFNYFEKNLRVIFENNSLELEFDYNDYNFYIKEPNKEKYTLNTLSSGFSSILKILTEIIIRMETKKNNIYDIPGLVIIDEVDAHLHLSLQKKVLKFLTDFFPNMQFIVTTHSPFVINSIENVIVYDIEKDISIEDLSSYSYKAILEEYFEIDEYSNVLKNNIEMFRGLSKKTNKSSSEKKQYNALKEKLNFSSDILSPELKLEITLLDLNRILMEDNQ